MAKIFESFFSTYDDSQIFYQIWQPKITSKGNVIITHGQAEHSGCYEKLALELAENGLTVFGWDLRGHGRSDGKRGFAQDFSDYVRDYGLFIAHLQNARALNLNESVLFAHSMGGLIQATSLIDSKIPAKAQVICNPMWSLAVEVPLVKDLIALAVNQVFPQITMYNEVQPTSLTSDPSSLAYYEKDVLRHDRISSGVYLGSIVAMESLKKTIFQINLPTLLQVSSFDPICDSSVAKSHFEKMTTTNKVLAEYANSKHEIYNDIERDQAVEDLKQFIDKILL